MALHQQPGRVACGESWGGEGCRGVYVAAPGPSAAPGDGPSHHVGAGLRVLRWVHGYLMSFLPCNHLSLLFFGGGGGFFLISI